MNLRLTKALFALLPAALLFFGSAIMFRRARTFYLFMQLFGAICILLVVLAHICEALHLLPGMHWGLEDSAGHYLDLVLAVLGLILFPAGYLLHAITRRQ